MRKRLPVILKNIFNVFVFSISFAIFLVLIPHIVYYCYLFGHLILDGGMLGGDSPYHMAMIRPLEQFFPKIPVWFPYGGSGMSLLLGYQTFPYYMAIIGSKLSQLNSAQWVRIFEFISVPVVCLEIYVFLWIRTKNILVGLIGAFLYPLSSMSYAWISHAGFYAMQLSSMFLIPPFLFFDLYLENELTGSEKVIRKRLYLLAYALFMAVGFLIHGSIMPCLYLGLPVYSIFRSQLNPRQKENRFSSLIKSIKVLLIFVVVGILSGLYVFLPQQNYLSNQPFTPTYGVEDTPILPWRQFLGFEQLGPQTGSLYTPLFMSLFVSVCALIGTVLALIGRKRMAALGVTILFYVWWLSAGRYLSAHFPFLRIFILPTDNRAATVTSIFITIMAAYGLWLMADVPGTIVRFLIKKITPANRIGFFMRNVATIITLFVASVIVVILTYKGVYNFRSRQIYPSIEKSDWGPMEGYPGYGTLGMMVPLCKVPGWEKLAVDPTKSCDYYMPKNVIDASYADFWQDFYVKDVDSLGMDKFTRVAVTPFLGTTVFSFTRHSDASLVSAAANVAVVNLDWLGIHDRALFLDGGNHTPTEVAEISKWTGTKYSFLQGGQSPLLSRYPDNIWPVVLKSGGVEVREFKQSSGFATLSNKPTILVIGSVKQNSYSTILQVVFKGAVSFDQALIVKGKPNIDDYNLNELNKYSVLLLRGYGYRNQNTAWNLLKKYVEGGGSLFFDTGWQFVSKDWGSGPDRDGKFKEIAIPEPSPVKKTLWGGVGTSWNGGTLDQEIGKGLDLTKFGTPAWENIAYGMAVAKSGDLQKWADPVLSVGNNVLVAKGIYGKGKVVWSGMNLFSHAYDRDNQEEYNFLKNIFEYLLPSGQIQNGKYSASWDFPDELDLTLDDVPSNSHFLYWPETYTPNWQATLVSNGKSKSLAVLSAGPGFQAIDLTGVKSGDKIVMRYSIKKILIIAVGTTILTFLILILHLLDALLFKCKFENILFKNIKGKKVFSSENASFLKKKLNSAVHWDQEE